MEENQENNEIEKTEAVTAKEKTTKKKRGCALRFFKFIFYIITFFSVLIVTFIILFQTNFFKTWLLHIALDKVNESFANKESKFHIERLEGALFSDFKLIGINAVVKNDTMLKVDTLGINYNILKLLDKEIIVNSLTLINPEINMTKVISGNDTLWNFAHLLKSDKPEEEDTTTKEFDWGIKAGEFNLINGKIRMLEFKPDNTIPIRSVKVKDSDSLNINNLDITGLNISLGGEYYPGDKKAEIRNISFNTNSKFQLQKLAFNASLNKKYHAVINNLIFQTERSNVLIRKASMENLNPANIDYEAFVENQTEIDLTVDKFDAEDLDYFIHDVEFLQGKVYLDLKASGNYGNILFDRFTVSTERTSISFNGRVKNLHKPENLYIDVSAYNTVLDPMDIKTKLPGLKIPDYSNVGIVSGNFTFVGEPLDFYTKFDIKSGVGNISGDGKLNLKPKEMVYRASVKADGVNLEKVTGIGELRGPINTEFKVEGQGVDYRTMRTKLDFVINNSSVYGQNISRSEGQIQLNGGSANLDIKYLSQTLGSIIKGTIDFKNEANISYDLKGQTSKLDFATLTNNPEDKTDLNLEFSLAGAGFNLASIKQGTGFKPDDLTGEYLFKVDKSVYTGLDIPPSDFVIDIKLENGEKFFNVKSSFIDLQASGNYRFEIIPTILASNIKRITYQYAERLKLELKDSLGVPIKISDMQDLKTLPPEMKLVYSINIKNFLPIRLIMRDSSMTFTGNIKGELSQNKNKFNFLAGGRINNFSYKDTVFNLSETNFAIKLEDDNEGDIFEDITTNIYVSASKLGFGKTNTIDTVNFYFHTLDTNNLFRLYSKVDSNLKGFLKGDIVVLENGVGILVDSLDLGYKNYNFFNRRDARIFFLPRDSINNPVNNIFIDNLVLKDSLNQRIIINGIYSINGASDITVSGSRISIPELFNLAKIQKQEQYIKGDIRRFKINFKGTLENPEIYSELNTDPLKYEKNNIGRMDAIVQYKDNVLLPDLAYYNQNSTGKLFINGNYPLENPIVTAQTDVDYLDKDVTLKIIAENFQIKILERFIPLINHLDAKLNSDLTIRGKISNPEFSGKITIDDGRFTVDMTGVRYKFKTEISTEGRKLLMNNFKLLHTSSDTKFINIGGYIDMANLIPSDINLDITGDVLILDPAVSYNKLGVYGNLVGGSGTPPLIIRGNSDKVKMTGNFLLKKGKVFIPAPKTDAYNVYSDNIKYGIYFDSTNISNDSLFISELLRIDTAKANREIFLSDPFDDIFLKKDKDISKNEKKGNIFEYNISITTEDKLIVRFIIDDKTKQEFNGEVTTKLFADNTENGEMQIRGRADVLPNSSYKFYKNFKADGYLTFKGQMTNPELNIKASYTANTTVPNSQSTRSVEIILDVTGQAQKPDLKWQVLVNGSSVGGADPSDEAISFIIFGKLKDELNASQRLDFVTNIGANVGSSFLSGYISSFVQDFLPFILSTDINYVDNQGSSFAQNTDIRFTAGLGDATIRFGGQILTDLSNTNFSIEYPLSKLLGMNLLSNNLVAKFERIIDQFSQNQTSKDVRTGGGLIYRIKF